MTATRYLLKPTGMPPITFEGTCLAVSESLADVSPHPKRWHEIQVYHTPNQYVVKVEFVTVWQGEVGYTAVAMTPHVERLGELLSRLEDEVLLPPGRGFPYGARLAEQQARLREELQVQYRKRVGEVLGMVPGTAVEIE